MIETQSPASFTGTTPATPLGFTPSPPEARDGGGPLVRFRDEREVMPGPIDGAGSLGPVSDPDQRDFTEDLGQPTAMRAQLGAMEAGERQQNHLGDAATRKMGRRDVERAKLERDLSEWLQAYLPIAGYPIAGMPEWAMQEFRRGVACGLHVRVVLSSR